MGYFKCDWPDCRRRPFAEVFPFKKNGKGKWEETHGWNYLCFKHFLRERTLGMLGKRRFGWCKVNTDRQQIETILEEIYTIQSDLYDIKEKIGIKRSPSPLDKLWDNPEDDKWDEEDEKNKPKSKRKRKSTNPKLHKML